MKLNVKLLITYAIVGTILLLGIGYYASVSLRAEEFESVFEGFIAQLYQIDYALTSFLQEVEYDVQDLVDNEIVRTQDDEDFTSFLEADEATFEYHIGPTEQAIIDVLNTYRTNHPYANSVYMGRENGSFVRSHKRARPTQYDPRQRPWYQLALTDPGRVLRTPPYRSVTTPDVNIGTVKALVDEQGQVYGVVGIDITLRNLTDYISNVSVGEGSYIVLLDENGTVLTGPDEEALFKTYDEAGLAYFQEVMDNDQGNTWFNDEQGNHYLFYYTSPALGWKISAVVPVEEIDREVLQFTNKVVGLLALALLLLAVLTAAGVRWFIVQPINRLERSTRTIIRTGDLDHRIDVETRDEIGELAASFNEMVSSIKRAEVELRASEEKYRGLVENIPVGIFRSTPAGQLLHANPAAVKMLGYDSIEEALAIYLMDLYEDASQRDALIRRIESGEEIQNLELRLKKKDGTPIWVCLSVTAQYDRNGHVKWLEGVIEDIAARKAAEDALRRARDELEVRVAARTADLEARNAELDAFAHTVAHDLKNPVSTLVGYAELLLQDLAGVLKDQQKRFLRVIARNGRKMSTIVDELLLLASVREMEEINLHPLDMGHIVDEALGRLRYLIEESEGEIILPERWPVAVGYAPWVEEVWTNYISNALKYGGHPPRVELGAEEPASPATDPPLIRFWVHDNGPGLSPEELAGLFTPFERLHQVRVEGHGLGLSIVRRIMHKLGGQVGVESPSPGSGQGSTFYFALPALDWDEERGPG